MYILDGKASKALEQRRKQQIEAAEQREKQEAKVAEERKQQKIEAAKRAVLNCMGRRHFQEALEKIKDLNKLCGDSQLTAIVRPLLEQTLICISVCKGLGKPDRAILDAVMAEVYRVLWKNPSL